MSHTFETAVEFDLSSERANGFLDLATVVLGVGAFVLAAPAAWPLFPVLLLGAGLAAWLRERSRRVGRLHWSASGALRYTDPTGHDAHAELLPVQYVTRWLVVVRFRAGGRQRAARVWAFDRPEEHRLLALRLLTGRWRSNHR